MEIHTVNLPKTAFGEVPIIMKFIFPTMTNFSRVENENLQTAGSGRLWSGPEEL